MSKRPHDVVDKTEEDLNRQVYTGGICQRRLAVAMDMEGMELRSSVVLPMPVNFRPPYVEDFVQARKLLRLPHLRP